MKRIVGACIVSTALAFAIGIPAATANGGGSQDSIDHDGWHADRPPDGRGAGAMEVLIDGLNNPRQITIARGGVYVAEAGTGGDTCFDVAPDVNVCAGFTGSVTRYRNGTNTRVQTGLLSIASPEGDVVGVDDVVVKGGKLYGIMTGGCTAPGFSIPSALAAQAGKLLQLNGGDSVTEIGDPGTFECANNPDQQDPDTDPYGIAARDGTFYVADAAGNDIVKVANGDTSLVKVLSTNSQPVPTSLAWGPDGALYIGTLNFEAGPGGAIVYRLDVSTGELTEYATGLTAITAIAFGRHGTLYVAEWTTGFDENGPSQNGAVVAIPWGGGSDGRQTIGTGDLHFPTGVAVKDHALYVSNWGIAAAEGPGPHGQLVRFSLDGGHDSH